MDFNFLAEIAQPWTSNPAALTAGIRKFTRYGQSRIGGTAIFSAVYQACLNQFDKVDHTPAETSSCSSRMVKTMPAVLI